MMTLFCEKLLLQIWKIDNWAQKRVILLTMVILILKCCNSLQLDNTGAETAYGWLVTRTNMQLLMNLKGSDDGVWHSELPGFWTLSIVLNSK
jgi:hypothetical protein